MQNMIHYIFLTFEPMSLLVLVFFDNYLTYGENEESKYYTMGISKRLCVRVKEAMETLCVKQIMWAYFGDFNLFTKSSRDSHIICLATSSTLGIHSSYSSSYNDANADNTSTQTETTLHNNSITSIVIHTSHL